MKNKGYKRAAALLLGWHSGGKPMPDGACRIVRYGQYGQ